MPEPALLALTWRVTRRRLIASPLGVVAGLVFPAFVAWLGIADSYATAAKFFFFLLPHVFLVAAQDAVRTDVESGALENVLFLGGRFRGYLGAKSLFAAGAAAGYAAILFALFAAWGVAAGGFGADFVLKFGLAILAGLHYVALAGLLSHFLRAGSNVLVLLLAQSASIIALVFTTTARTGLLDYASTGRFPGLGAKVVFGAWVAILPNVIVSGRMPLFVGEVLLLLSLAVFVQVRLLRRLEIRK